MSSQEIENAFVNGAKKGSAAILLLLCVGVIVSMWIQSGMVPMIIYYGLGLFSPQILLLCTFLLCVLLSVCTGSSWGACGTIGIAVSHGKAWGFLLISQRALRFPEQLLGISFLPFQIQRYLPLIFTRVNIYESHSFYDENNNPNRDFDNDYLYCHRAAFRIACYTGFLHT